MALIPIRITEHLNEVIVNCAAIFCSLKKLFFQSEITALWLKSRVSFWLNWHIESILSIMWLWIFPSFFPKFVRKGWKVFANLLSSSGGLQRVCNLPMYHTISLTWAIRATFTNLCTYMYSCCCAIISIWEFQEFFVTLIPKIAASTQASLLTNFLRPFSKLLLSQSLIRNQSNKIMIDCEKQLLR